MEGIHFRKHKFKWTTNGPSIKVTTNELLKGVAIPTVQDLHAKIQANA